ncbi:E3 ubiquitin-protein ligase [Trifolium medium]|uniref:RING-type E3 ubiquitin transferase n=1 Tax=Trifolium medium TaxID=97028 RepID=A0A392PM61_9FABA|nr:E3 ubiquitin-protein ligase [Trifolium medium]
MASLGNPKAWVPYMNNKDCSQGFCSFYCPQWCYVVYPPPPPSPFEFPDDDSSTNFSPLVIAIIGILASAFLLVTYYTLISKYCGRRISSSQSESRETNDELEDNHHHNPSIHEPWHASTNGLDEALIKSITVSMLFIYLVLIHGLNLTQIVLYVALQYSSSMLQVQMQHFICQLKLLNNLQGMKFL